MERYIAIDNVCAWPNLTVLPDGTLAVAIYNQPIHGQWQGDVEVWASTDDGRLWEKRGVAALGESPGNRMDVSAGCAAAMRRHSRRRPIVTTSGTRASSAAHRRSGR